MKRILSLLFAAVLLSVSLSGCGGGGGSNNPTLPSDTSKPTVNSTTPAHNSGNVALNSAITVTFNEAIDPATINTQTQTFILLKDGTIPVTGTVTYIGTTAEFRPASSLSAGASYTATVTTGVKDLAGNAIAANYSWQFTTGAVSDSTPPTVLTTFPAANSVGVSLSSAIAVTFNEAIDPATINTQTFILLKDGTIPVTGTVTYIGTTAEFRPDSSLSAGASYTVKVTTGVKDLAGNALELDKSWSFTTGSASASDTVAPILLSLSPSNGATNVSVYSSLVVTFDESIRPSLQYGQIDGNPVALTFSDNYKTITMIPAEALKPNTLYFSKLTVRDMAGNLATFYWSFTTAP